MIKGEISRTEYGMKCGLQMDGSYEQLVDELGTMIATVTKQMQEDKPDYVEFEAREFIKAVTKKAVERYNYLANKTAVEKEIEHDGEKARQKVFAPEVDEIIESAMQGIAKARKEKGLDVSIESVMKELGNMRKKSVIDKQNTLSKMGMGVGDEEYIKFEKALKRGLITQQGGQ